ncbi:MAG: cold shock domain-containing protein [Bacteroidia bacterium]|nr:cold shock domain-containing protein [Bacteroidia bacterium]
MNQLLKIGLYYDGNYLSNVSNYYYFQHAFKTRINIEGLHEFLIQKISELEETKKQYCKITDAHYFRGRLNAADAKEMNKLYPDRVIDDMLMMENVVAHYMPLVPKKDGQKEEKGIDVLLALECLENALARKFDVLILVVCDSDYLHLVRKISALGIRVMLLSWNFHYVDDFGIERGTFASWELTRACNYPMMMQEMIEEGILNGDTLVNNIFRQYETKPTIKPSFDQNPKTSIIVNLNKEKGYGFIQYHPDNIFFHFSQIAESESAEFLFEGDTIEFCIGTNERDGKKMAKNIRKIQPAEDN